MAQALIIEDDADNCGIVKYILEMEGFRVITSETVPEIQRILDLSPAVILMDVWISGKFGGDLCLALKLNKSTGHIPIILVSGDSRIADVAKESKADFYIAKPYDLDVLMKMVNHLTRFLKSENT